jgi:hypothetical protein
MSYLFKTALIILIGIFISSCAPVHLLPDNKPVRIILYDEIEFTKSMPDCEYIGPIVSSYGRWHNYLFISNADLTSGAIDDMYNKANEVGANTVYIYTNITFVTSVTFLGQAYNCR